MVNFRKHKITLLGTILLASCGGGGGGSTPLELSVASFSEFQLIENQTGSWPIEASSNKSNPISHSISGGPDSSFFSMSGNILSFAGTANYEAPNDTNKDSVYEVYINTTSDGVSSTQTIYVRVADAPEAPVISTAAIENVNENTTSVATISATDEDLGSVLIFSLLDSAGAKDEQLLSINESGVVTFITSPNFEAPADYNADNTIEFTVIVSDGSLSNQIDYSFSVIDVNESPSITTTEISNIGEGVSSIATIAASDQDADSSLSYSLVDSSGAKDEDLLSIDSSTGAVSFKIPPNYESPGDVGADNKIEFSVLVSDGSLEVSQDYSFSITDINEAPIISSASFSIAEQSTAIGTISASDPDSSATLSYSISGTDASKFSINSSSGSIAFLAAPNYESPTDNGLDNTYDFTVTVSDGSLSASQSISVAVGNLNEAPSFSTASAQSYTENSGATISVTANDPDASSLLAYSLSGTDASQFSISSSGVLSFASAPDYESPSDSGLNNIFNVSVGVTDGVNSSSVSLVISLIDDTSDNYGIKLPGKVALAELKKES